MAAAFRSLGVDAHVSPESDEETLRLSARFTTGEECLPQRVVLGNFLKVILAKDFNPEKNAFLLPTSSGPCRFGQYAPLLVKVLKDLDFENAIVFSPTSSDGYKGIAADVNQFLRTGWRAVVASDVLRKLLYIFRPYERDSGSTENVHDDVLEQICEILADATIDSKKQLKRLAGIMEGARDRFSKIPLKEELGSRPLIGAVGEIYLRFNSYSNQHIIRRIESAGGEVWIADISEWVWYTNAEEKRKLRDMKRHRSLSWLSASIRHRAQHLDEVTIQRPLSPLIAHRPEAPVTKLLNYSQPYLPVHMALGEMTLNTGKAIAFQKAGCHGVIDISPFTCMNGIVTEVVYPHVSRELDDFPIRIFYFDGVPFDLEGDIEIFMEQVKAYKEKRGAT